MAQYIPNELLRYVGGGLGLVLVRSVEKLYLLLLLGNQTREIAPTTVLHHNVEFGAGFVDYSVGLDWIGLGWVGWGGVGWSGEIWWSEWGVRWGGGRQKNGKIHSPIIVANDARVTKLTKDVDFRNKLTLLLLIHLT